MNYEEFKAILAEKGITPIKNLFDIAVDSIASAGPDALKDLTGFSSKEKLLSSKSKSELASLIESLFVDIADRTGDELEDAMGFETIEKFINYDPRATDEDINRVEKTLGVKLPSDFVQFHKEFGAISWIGFRAYKVNGGYEVDSEYSDLGSFYSAKWDKDDFCSLVAEQEDWNWQGEFVKIGGFDEEDFNRALGHFGFLVTDGICENGVSWLDHEYRLHSSLENCSSRIDDSLGFILGEVDEEYRTVNPNDDDFDNDDFDDDDFDEREESELVKAVMSGNVLRINELLSASADVNAENESGDTALSIAAYNGHLDAVTLLIEHGADINHTDNEGDTALKVVSASQVETARLLLRHGAEVDVKDKDGDTALGNAAYHGCLDAINLLLEHGAELNDTNNIGYTPLIVAAWQGRVEAVRMLLEHGAEVDVRNVNGETALSLASTDEIKKLLIDAGAKAEN